MPPLTRTPGGLLLPTGTPLGTAIPDLAGTHFAATGIGATRIAPTRDARVPGQLVSYQDIYETTPDVSSCVDKIARNAARVPIRLWRRPAGDGVVQEVHDHPILDLLRRPAPGCGHVELTQWLFHSALKHGNGLIGKYRPDGPDTPPTELFPLDWRYISAYRWPAGRIAKWVTSEGSRIVYLNPDEVLHIAWDSGQGSLGQIGVAPLKRLGDPIEVGNAAVRHNLSQLTNGLHANLAFEVPDGKEVTPTEQVMLRAALDAMQGVDRSGQVPVLIGGAKLVEPGRRTAEEAQVVGVRKLSREDVCMVYDIAPVVLGLLENASQRGNVADLIADFFGNTMTPWFALGANVINRQLIDTEPAWLADRLFVAFDPSEFLRGDPLKWAQAQEIKMRSGGITLDEMRGEDGREPYNVAGSNEPILSSNNYQPLSQVISGAASTARETVSTAARRLVGRTKDTQ